MRFRWTIKQMQTLSDNEILRGLVAERTSDLNPYCPLAVRLRAIYNTLDQAIARQAHKGGRR